MMKTEFNFILPVCEGRSRFTETLESVLASTLGNLRLLCLVPGERAPSVRATLESRTRKDPRVRVVEIDPDPEGNDAIRAVGRFADAPWTILLHEGDRVSPHLAALSRLAFEENEADIVYCRPREVPRKDSPLENKVIINRDVTTFSLPVEKAQFFAHPAARNRVFRTDFLLDPRVLPPAGTADEIRTGYRAIVHARSIVELPDALYQPAPDDARTASVDAAMSRNEALAFVDLSREFADELRSLGLLGDYGNPYARSVLHALMRFCARAAHTPASPRPEEIVAGIAARLPSELHAFYREARFSVTETEFLRNVLRIDSDSLRSGPYETVPLVPSPGTKTPPLGPVDHNILFSNEHFSILSASLDSGKPALGELGYDGWADALLPPDGISKHTHAILSARCPSTIKLHLKRKSTVSGFLNGTATYSPYTPCRFSISGEPLGNLAGPRDRTAEIVLEPGYYELETACCVPMGMHSLWAVAEYGKTTLDANAVAIIPCGSPLDIASLLRTHAIREALHAAGYRTNTVDWSPKFEHTPSNTTSEKTATDDVLDHMRTLFEPFRNSLIDIPFRGGTEKPRDVLGKLRCKTVLFDGLDLEIADHFVPGISDLVHSLQDDVRAILASVDFRANNIPHEATGAWHNILSRADAVGVRDDLNAEIARELGAEETRKIADPLFLLDRTRWENAADPNVRNDKPYLLLYMLKHNPDAFDLASLLRAHFGYEILFVPSAALIARYMNEDALPDVDRTVVIEPGGFLTLVRNAKYVLADSACGVALASIFQVPFFSLFGFDMARSEEAAIRDILVPLSLTDRIVQPRNGGEIQLNLEPSFEGVEAKIKSFAAETLNFFSPPRELRDATREQTASAFPAPATVRPDYPDPEFTVALPVYNMGPYIDDTIGSILASTYKNFRLVTCDNASTDGSREKIREWARRDTRIVALENEENLGPHGNAATISRYLSQSQTLTPHLTWIDADDMISPHYMDVLLRTFDKYDADAVFHQAIFLNEQGDYIAGGTRHGNPVVISERPEEKAFYFCKPAASDKCWNHRITAMLYRSNKAPAAIPARAHFDLHINIRLLTTCRRIVEIPDALYYRRLRPGSITNRNADESQLDAVIVYRNVRNFLAANDYWAEYKELWLRYKLNHLVWLHGHVAPSLRPRLLAAVAADMDREERWFYREAKFEATQRQFLRETLKIAEYQIAPNNVYPPLVAFNPTLRKIALDDRADREDGDAYYENDILIVHSGTVGAGRLGIGELGYGGPLVMPANVRTDTHVILGARCPSKIRVTIKRKSIITGFMNGTSPWSGNSNCLFSVSKKLVGCLFGPNDKTPETFLEPGTYELEISGLEPDYKHSAWAIREAKPERIKMRTGPDPTRRERAGKTKKARR